GRVLTVTGDMTVSYEIVQAVNEYTVTVVSSDKSAGTVTLGSIAVPYGSAVSASGTVLAVGDFESEAVVADDTPEYAYAFVGWDIPSRTVSGDMTVVAEFSATLVSFVYEDVRYLVLEDATTVSAIGFEGEPVSLAVPDVVSYDGMDFVPVSIEAGAFAGCATVTDASVGSTVASIGEGAFDSPYLKSITVSDENEVYSSVAGVLYDKDESVLLKFPASKQRLVIPSTVTEIAAGAFKDAGAALKADYESGAITYFRYVSIPGTVTKVGDSAFSGSTLETLKLADGTKTIGAGAFAGCESLNYVLFNETLESVAADAFDGCVFIGEDGEEMSFAIDAISGHKFTGKDSSCLEMYVPPVGGTITYGGVDYRITDNGESKTITAVGLADSTLTDLVIPASVGYLGFEWDVSGIASKAFYGNTTITTVTSAADVGFKAFANCSSLETVVLDGAASLGAYAFASCSALVSVDLGSVTAIGESAFSGCKSLSDIDLGAVETIGKHAFYGCKSLSEADLGSAESIGYGAFTGTSLRKVSFSAGLTDVDAKAFFGYKFKDADGAKMSIDASSLAGKTFSGTDGVLCL
ncbi:MAG: leucine-rich repeat domain-containing protein, partial [Thermoplasmata archaeon]|nr:leucine-rich repeat domain-containing protein [Thermoplasmata archaeon]